MRLLVVHEMTLVLVFSRDRALQLQAALTSFQLLVADLTSAPMVVLYRATSARHQAQYQRLAEEQGDRASFVPESDFRRQVIEILNGSVPKRGDPIGTSSRHEASAQYCLFLVDDSIFVRSLRLGHAEQALQSNPDALGFSLRLGRNTSYCYTLRRPQALPKFEILENGVLRFRWPRSDGDFGYPLEISSSLYGLEMISGLVQGLDFNSPSSLESQMSVHGRDFSRSRPALLCCEKSVAFSAPLNRVQMVYENRVADSSRFSVEHLADLFDQGRRINVRSLTGFVPNACHQEVELDFERSDDHN